MITVKIQTFAYHGSRNGHYTLRDMQKALESVNGLYRRLPEPFGNKPSMIIQVEKQFTNEPEAIVWRKQVETAIKRVSCGAPIRIIVER